MKVSVEGRERLATKLKGAARSSQSEMDRERVRSAEHLLGVSIPVTPMSAGENRGELRRSGYADHTLIPNTSVVGFSDPKSPFVHEMGHDEADDDPTDDPDGRINWTTPGTGKKFLTGPFLEWRQVYARNMIAAARRGLHDG